MAPLISHVYELGLMEAISIPQTECFQGNCLFPEFAYGSAVHNQLNPFPFPSLFFSVDDLFKYILHHYMLQEQFSLQGLKD